MLLSIPTLTNLHFNGFLPSRKPEESISLVKFGILSSPKLVTKQWRKLIIVPWYFDATRFERSQGGKHEAGSVLGGGHCYRYTIISRGRSFREKRTVLTGYFCWRSKKVIGKHVIKAALVFYPKQKHTISRNMGMDGFIHSNQNIVSFCIPVRGIRIIAVVVANNNVVTEFSSFRHQVSRFSWTIKLCS